MHIDLDQLDHDPYPVYEAIRAAGGVAWIEPLKLWYVVGYQDARAILNDSTRFVVGTGHSLIRDLFGDNMLTLDGAPQQRVRGRFSGAFAPAAVRAAMTQRLVAVVDHLIAGFPQGREVDLRPAFAARLPVLAMLALFGIDADAEPMVRRWYDVFERAIGNFAGDPVVRAQGHSAAAEFRRFFAGHIDAARRHRRDGLLRDVLDAPADDRLLDAEIIDNALLIFFGGISTVEALLLNTLYASALHGYRVSDARSITRAIDETMRWLSPVQSATRHVVTAIGPFAHGDTVNAMLGGANRDPAKFIDPNRWDPARPGAAHHLGFATGAHFCLGSHLARLEVATAIEGLFARVPGLRIIDPPAVEVRGYEFRQPQTLLAARR